MSCETEATWSGYVDGELPPEALRRVEAHLVRCERCRATVLALREESDLFRAVFAGPDPRPAPEAAVAGPQAARGLAWGLPISLALALAVTSVGGWLLENHLPAGVSWLAPSRLIGVNEMLFDLLFAVRDRAPGLLELAVALAATASVAMLVTFAAGVLLRRVGGGALLGLGLALLLTSAAAPAEARVETLHQDEVRIAQGERVEATLVASAESVEVEGTLVGDLFVFTERLALRGRVEGNVFAFARDVEITGTVTGGVHIAGDRLSVEGDVGGGLYAAAERVRLERRAQVARDLMVAAGETEVEGLVARDLTAFTRRLELRGEVGGDVTTWADHVALRGEARVGGALQAHVPDPAAVEIDPDARVAGATDVQRQEHAHGAPFARYAHLGFYLWALVQLAMAFAVGLGLRALFPGLFTASIATGRAFFVALGLGFAAAVLTPVAALLLALTVVGLPLALIALGVFGVALYLAGIEVAALVGRALVRPRGEDLRSFGMTLVVGLAVVVIATRLPFVGGPLRVLVVLVGLGLLVERAWGRLRRAPRPGRMPVPAYD